MLGRIGLIPPRYGSVIVYRCALIDRILDLRCRIACGRISLQTGVAANVDGLLGRLSRRGVFGGNGVNPLVGVSVAIFGGRVGSNVERLTGQHLAFNVDVQIAGAGQVYDETIRSHRFIGQLGSALRIEEERHRVSVTNGKLESNGVIAVIGKDGSFRHE